MHSRIGFMINPFKSIKVLKLRVIHLSNAKIKIRFKLLFSKGPDLEIKNLLNLLRQKQVN